MMDMRKAKVIKNHESEYTASFLVKAGTILVSEEKESEWEGWMWCKSPEGIYTWFPEGFLKRIAGKLDHYELIRDYNAKELPVRTGEEVTIQFEESSWAWVLMGNGNEGWVPLENLEVVD
jgi:hypothetical protein